jgi:hypothetical protein
MASLLALHAVLVLFSHERLALLLTRMWIKIKIIELNFNSSNNIVVIAAIADCKRSHFVFFGRPAESKKDESKQSEINEVCEGH